MELFEVKCVMGWRVRNSVSGRPLQVDRCERVHPVIWVGLEKRLSVDASTAFAGDGLAARPAESQRQLKAPGRGKRQLKSAERCKGVGYILLGWRNELLTKLWCVTAMGAKR